MSKRKPIRRFRVTFEYDVERWAGASTALGTLQGETEYAKRIAERDFPDDTDVKVVEVKK